MKNKDKNKGIEVTAIYDMDEINAEQRGQISKDEKKKNRKIKNEELRSKLKQKGKELGVKLGQIGKFVGKAAVTSAAVIGVVSMLTPGLGAIAPIATGLAIAGGTADSFFKFKDAASAGAAAIAPIGTESSAN